MGPGTARSSILVIQGPLLVQGPDIALYSTPFCTARPLLQAASCHVPTIHSWLLVPVSELKEKKRGDGWTGRWAGQRAVRKGAVWQQKCCQYLFFLPCFDPLSQTGPEPSKHSRAARAYSLGNVPFPEETSSCPTYDPACAPVAQLHWERNLSDWAAQLIGKIHCMLLKCMETGWESSQLHTIRKEYILN